MKTIFFGFVLLLLSLGANAKYSSGFLLESADGTELFAKFYEAEAPTAQVLIVHGLQSHSDWYQNGDHLRAEGLNALIFDRRGSGRSRGKRGHADNKEKLLEDLDAAFNYLKDRNPDLPIHVIANSMGFFLTLPYAKNNPQKFASIVLTTPSAAVQSDVEYSLWEKFIILTSPSKKYFDTTLEDTDFVSEGPWLNWIEKDFLGQREFTAGFLRSLNNLRPIANDVKSSLLSEVPLLLLLARGDRIVDNKKTETGFFADYPGPKLIKTLDSEHFLGFGKSALEAEQNIMNWLQGGYRNL